MIEYTHEISNKDGYKQFNNFIFKEELKDILRDDYFLFGSNEFKNQELCEELYKKNFYDKYDKDANSLIYSKYINNQKFKDKALFIYSIIDFEKYKKFVEKNEDIENPNDYTIKFSIIDSQNTKVLIYNLNLVDISFVF